MASGFSWSGGPPPCFVYWQKFQECYVQTDTPRECIPQSNDYLECLHHPKEVARAREIEAEYIRKQAHQAKENKKISDSLADGVILGVGLIRRGKEESSPSPSASSSSSSEGAAA